MGWHSKMLKLCLQSFYPKMRIVRRIAEDLRLELTCNGVNLLWTVACYYYHEQNDQKWMFNRSVAQFGCKNIIQEFADHRAEPYTLTWYDPTTTVILIFGVTFYLILFFCSKGTNNGVALFDWLIDSSGLVFHCSLDRQSEKMCQLIRRLRRWCDGWLIGWLID